MSILDTSIELTKVGTTEKILSPISLYQPDDLSKDRLMMIRQDFTDGDIVMKRPRREFNDMSMLERSAIDQMAFAVYQPNDGDALAGDELNSWRSNATRPIVRNKIMSINAHVTARTMYPKIHAFNEQSDEESEASTVMGDLMEWSVTANNSVYADVTMASSLSALINPISWTHTQYQTVYKRVKRGKKDDGTYETELVLDEDNSGFVDESIPPDQMYFGEFYVRGGNVQLQPWLIRRRVLNYQSAKTLLQSFPNFEHVRPGIQVMFNDANQSFYETYDVNMRQNEVEVIYYWNKALDLYLIACNGVLLTDPDNANPREDKLYPFATHGYELLRANGDCMAYKSLAFKTMPDDKVVNTLYPMIIDASYMALFPPTVAIGVETIGSDVLIPGQTTTMSDANADIKPILAANQNLKAGYDALFEVEKNITESSIDGKEGSNSAQQAERTTAYQISKEEEKAKLLLGSFLIMQGRYVKQMGRLRIGDIKQYLTLPEVSTIEGSASQKLVYKTFMMTEGKGRMKARKIKFDMDLPDETLSTDDLKDISYKIFDEQGGIKSPYQLHKVNPLLFRKLKYMVIVTPDVLAPLSEDYENQMQLEQYDRMIQAPMVFDPHETGRLLLDAYPKTKKNPDKYLAPATPQMPPQGQPGQGSPQPAPRPTTPGMPQLPQITK